MNKNSYLIPITIVVAILIVVGAVIYKNSGSGGTAGNVENIGNVSVDDDAVLGDSNAPVTIIEFSDYECPYCRKFWADTMPQIKEKYINTGKVKFVYRDFPLSSHKDAQKAAEATECAEKQGKFWEMQDKIFENQSAIAVGDLKKYAVDLGLDVSSFNKCLDSGEYKDEVKKDFPDVKLSSLYRVSPVLWDGPKIDFSFDKVKGTVIFDPTGHQKVPKTDFEARMAFVKDPSQTIAFVGAVETKNVLQAVAAAQPFGGSVWNFALSSDKDETLLYQTSMVPVDTLPLEDFNPDEIHH